MGKLSLGLGLAVGYVLGARAGKEKYDQIVQAASGVMGRPEVQQAVSQAVEQARAVAPAPLQGTIDKLAASATGGGSGGASGGSGSGGASGGTTVDDAGRTPAGTIAGEATLLGDVEAVVPPPPATTGTTTTTGTAPITGGPVTDDVPVPDPLVPPAKSKGTGRA